jgi:hypothetical protein
MRKRFYGWARAWPSTSSTTSRALGNELVLALVLALVGVTGCSKKSEPPPPPSATSAETASPPAASVPSSVAPSTPPFVLNGRLAQELANRPPTALTVEKVFDAFTKTGAKLLETKQHLASPFLAKYCMEAHTEEGVYTDVCEYGDEATATQGKDASSKAFSTVPNRTLYQNKKTTLTLRNGNPGPKTTAQVTTFATTFKAL